MARKPSYQEVLTEAVADLSANGYDSAERLAYWERRLREAAETSLLPLQEMERLLREALAASYKRLIEDGAIYKHHPGVSRFTVERLKPELRAELNRRILANAQLIKLNRREAIEKTVQRFSGWGTSIPAGGSETVDRREEKARIGKALRSLPFEERRVLIDQSHKLVASLNETIARGGGALGLVWRSHWRQPGYNYRIDHKERDGHFYMLRGNWAQEQGLVKVGPDGYYESITAVGQEPFCRCFATWIYNLRDVPEGCVTVKGKAALSEARAKIAAMA